MERTAKKYVVVLFDGMADYPDEKGNTPMKEAYKPFSDALAAKAETGLCQTVPDGMKPGSDVANLSVMGYAPERYYTGRSPLEALSIGVKMGPEDVSYRCNLVTLSETEDYENKIMTDYSAGEITTQEAHELIAFLSERLPLDGAELYGGVSYRHCLLLKNAGTGAILTPPHDISDRKITEYLPEGEHAESFLKIMKKSYELLKDHPVNLKRRERGLNPANSVWLWGEGRKPALDDFYRKHGLKGAVISAVDLIKGIGIAAGMEVIDVQGATGTIKSNFDGKAEAAINALKKNDFVYIHLEAPDECGHQGNYAEKKLAIELIDRKIVGPVLRYLESQKTPFKIAILPDHATPVVKKTHVSDPVPYLIYDSEHPYESGVNVFDEENAAKTGVFTESGVAFMEKLLA